MHGYCLPCDKDFIDESGVCRRFGSNEYFAQGKTGRCEGRTVPDESRTGCAECGEGEDIHVVSGRSVCDRCPPLTMWNSEKMRCECGPDHVYIKLSRKCHSLQLGKNSPDCAEDQILVDGECKNSADVCQLYQRLVFDASKKICVHEDYGQFFDSQVSLIRSCPPGSVSGTDLPSCDSCPPGQLSESGFCASCGDGDFKVGNDCIRSPVNSSLDESTKSCKCSAGLAMSNGASISLFFN